MKPNLIVVMEGGLISHFVSDSEMDIIVIDYDTEGLNESDLTDIDGDKAYVYTHEIPLEDINSRLINDIKKYIGNIDDEMSNM